jgi:hypothetical protein
MTTTRTIKLAGVALAALLQAAAPVRQRPTAPARRRMQRRSQPSSRSSPRCAARRPASTTSTPPSAPAMHRSTTRTASTASTTRPTARWASTTSTAALVGDAELDATKPEALIYAPMPDGTLRLIGMEYIVFQSTWHAVPGHTQPPRLFGQTFHSGGADNRYGIPAYYALHLWLWDHNPSGLFEDWNPTVRCP